MTVWKQEEEEMEAREHGYLTLLQLRSPTHTFRRDLSMFKSQGIKQRHDSITLLKPPWTQLLMEKYGFNVIAIVLYV